MISAPASPGTAVFCNRHSWNTATTPEKVWKAPKVESASCRVPATAYVAAVCVSSCATPDQQILAQAEARLNLRYVPFIEALTANYAKAATLSGGSLGSKTVDLTPVEQWVTEMMDTEHDIRNFRMKSGRVLRLTPNHPVVTSIGTVKLAQDFKVGESLVQLGGHLDQIVAINDTKYTGKVYNLFVKSADPLKNIVVTNGYLNGTAFFQNEGSDSVNRTLLRHKLVRGVFAKRKKLTFNAFGVGVLIIGLKFRSRAVNVVAVSTTHTPSIPLRL